MDARRADPAALPGAICSGGWRQRPGPPRAGNRRTGPGAGCQRSRHQVELGPALVHGSSRSPAGSPLAIQLPLCRGTVGHGALLSRAIPIDCFCQSPVLLSAAKYPVRPVKAAVQAGQDRQRFCTPALGSPSRTLHKVRLGNATIWRYPGHLGQSANSLGRTSVQVASRTRPAALFSIQHYGRKTGVPLLRDPNCYATR